MNPPCVMMNHNGVTAIFVKRGSKLSWYIPMSSSGLTVVREAHKQVLTEWRPIVYDVRKAAERFTKSNINKTELVEAILESLVDSTDNFNSLD